GAVAVAARLHDGALLGSARGAFVHGMDAVFWACAAGSLAAGLALWAFQPRRARGGAASPVDGRESDHEHAAS
ncbi:hypothetical protein, partial [Actinomadura roseirufa]|uniref:hypothetical protein n=1 Tax=Actinomadura roseirufa TaxID=2094049 RepID=UPI001A95513F